MTDNIKVIDTDNRDDTTTTLTLSTGAKVDVNPVDLFFNMVENCYDPDNEDVDTSNLQDWVDKLNEILAAHQEAK